MSEPVDLEEFRNLLLDGIEQLKDQARFHKAEDKDRWYEAESMLYRILDELVEKRGVSLK